MERQLRAKELFRRLEAGESVDGIERMLESGVDLDYRDYIDFTALHVLSYAFRVGSVPYTVDETCRLIDLLVKHGADVNAQDNDGKTPLMQFALTFSSDAAHCIEHLLNNNADVNMRNSFGLIQLHLCPKQQDWLNRRAVFKMILEKTSDINLRDNYGRSPLLAAAVSGTDPDCIQMLLEAGADVNLVDADGNNVLHCLALSDFDDVSDVPALIKTLIVDYGVDVNATNLFELTPVLMSTQCFGYPRLIISFLKNGANIFHMMKKTRKVSVLHCLLHRVNLSGMPETFIDHKVVLLELFLDCGCEIDTEQREGICKLVLNFDKHKIMFLEILFMNAGFLSSEDELVPLQNVHSEMEQTSPTDSSTTLLYDMLRKYTLLFGENDPQKDAHSTDEVERNEERKDKQKKASLDLCSQQNGGPVDFQPELNKLKTVYVNEKVTLFKLCKENDRRKLGRYLRDGCNVDLPEWKKEFPNYIGLIEYKLEVAEKWHGILEKVRALPCWRSTTSGGVKVELPSLCVDRIMEFLTNFELMVSSTGDDLAVYYKMRFFNSLE